jgi:hypothetical protein
MARKVAGALPHLREYAAGPSVLPRSLRSDGPGLCRRAPGVAVRLRSYNPPVRPEREIQAKLYDLGRSDHPWGGRYEFFMMTVIVLNVRSLRSIHLGPPGGQRWR